MQFTLFGFPVRIDPSFWFMAIILGGAMVDAHRAMVWVVVVLVSILVHEMGHALAARQYGFRPSILLYSMGGMTSWQMTHEISEWKRILVSAAGPAAGFVLGTAVILVKDPLLVDASGIVQLAVRDLIWVNIGWGLLNLLPIMPLDGGNIMNSVAVMLRGKKDSRIPLYVSISVSSVLCVLAVQRGMIWGGILTGWMAFSNFRSLQTLSKIRGSR
jgi:stage IV sporulation protein FB